MIIGFMIFHEFFQIRKVVSFLMTVGGSSVAEASQHGQMNGDGPHVAHGYNAHQGTIETIPNMASVQPQETAPIEENGVASGEESAQRVSFSLGSGCLVSITFYLHFSIFSETKRCVHQSGSIETEMVLIWCGMVLVRCCIVSLQCQQLSLNEFFNYRNEKL